MRMSDCLSSYRHVNRAIRRKLLQNCFFAASPGARRHAGEATEPRTETAQALESYREANLGYWQLSAFQKKFRPLHPASREILMRRQSKNCLEFAHKVIRRQTGGGGDVGNCQCRLATRMNEVAPAIQSAPQFFTRRDASCGQGVALSKRNVLCPQHSGEQ